MQSSTPHRTGPTANDASLRWLAGGGALQMAFLASVLLIVRYPVATGLLIVGVGLGVVLGYVMARRLDDR